MYSPFCGFDLETNKPVENLFSTRDRDHHRGMRSSVAQAYSLSTLRQLEPLVDGCTQTFINKMVEMKGQNVPLDEWVQYYSFDVIAMITFNNTFGFMEDRDKNRSQVLDGLHHGNIYNAVVGQTPFIHKLLLGNANSVKLLMRIPAMRKANPIIVIDHLIDEAIENHQPQKLTPRGDHLDTFRTFQQLNPHRFSETDFRSCLHANLFAGSDTTAISLRTAFYFLLKSPSKYEKLTREIDAADSDGSLSPMVTFQEGVQLHYLQAVIKESLRIHPAVVLPLERVMPSEGAQIGEYFYPAGTVVGASAWVVNFTKSVYGDDADEFLPERWIEADAEQLKQMERTFLSFGQGTRTCIGKNIALLEMTKFIPQVLRHFRLEWAAPDQDWKTEGYFFAKQSNMPIKLTERTKGG